MAWPKPSRVHYRLVLLALSGAVLPAAAKTYCCNDESGRRVCGDLVPAQCMSRGYQEYNSQGVMARQYEPPLTAEQRARRDAELVRKKEVERLAAEQDRRDRALLASYSSVQDIDAKRDRTLAVGNASLRALQERQETALARKQKLAAEAEFFQKRPMPGALKMNLRDNEAELASLQTALDDRKKDIAAAQARFDEEKKRFLNLIGNNKAAQGAALPGRSPAATPPAGPR